MQTKLNFNSIYEALNALQVQYQSCVNDSSNHFVEHSQELINLKRTWLEYSLLLQPCSLLLPNFTISQSHLLQYPSFKNCPILSSQNEKIKPTPVISKQQLEASLRDLLKDVLLHFSGQAIHTESDITNASQVMISSLQQLQSQSNLSLPPILPFFKDAVEYLDLFLNLLNEHTLLLRYSEHYVDYYQTVIQVSLLKLQILFEKEINKVFDSDVKHLCKLIENQLISRKKKIEAQILQTQLKLNSFSLGTEFQRQVQELIQVRKEIETHRSEKMWF